ncbi:MAG: hypothetical protein H7210_12665 [Pyrinomonadaceae bacterium]|nr:hypothetical protein [Phycisphaerales bacterium]
MKCYVTSILAIALTGAPAHAQLTGFDQAHSTLVGETVFGSSEGARMVNSNHTATGTLLAQSARLNLRGDWSWATPRADALGQVTASAYYEFTCGSLPVELFGLSFDSNAKVVNGGGNGTLPQTQWIYQASIRERIGNSVDTHDPALYSVSRRGELTGNGYRVSDELAGPASGPVLAVGRSYYMLLEARVGFDVTGFTPQTPSITVTQEFGGELSNYRGFELNMSWRVVPSPGSGALLGIGSMLVCRRRRGIC